MASSKKGVELTNLEKTRIDLQKEVLTAIFNASEEPEEELPRRTVPRMKRPGAFGRLVSEPFKDMAAECEKRVEYKEQTSSDGLTKRKIPPRMLSPLFPSRQPSSAGSVFVLSLHPLNRASACLLVIVVVVLSLSGFFILIFLWKSSVAVSKIGKSSF